MRCAHRVLVVFDHEHTRQVPKGGHVECFVYLTLVGSAVTEVGERHASIVEIFVSEGEASTKWNLRGNNADLLDDITNNDRKVKGELEDKIKAALDAFVADFA